MVVALGGKEDTWANEQEMKGGEERERGRKRDKIMYHLTFDPPVNVLRVWKDCTHTRPVPGNRYQGYQQPPVWCIRYLKLYGYSMVERKKIACSKQSLHA